jgi:hypothetical protein
MTHDDRLEQLLADHAAAVECGLLKSGPTPAELARVAAAMAPTIAPGSSTASPFRQRIGWLLAVAAALVVGVSLWAFNSPRGADEPLATFFEGRARVMPVKADTRFTVTDAAHGKIRLDQGEVYVELAADQNLKVEVETPAGTATALGTRFYVHYAKPSAVSTTAMLAVAVLGGLVEVANSHGTTVGRAGEVVVAEADTAPQSQAELAPPPLLRDGDWRSFGRTLGLLHYPEVQAELKLTDAQKARLVKDCPEERAKACQFFKDLQAASHEERAKKSEGFRDQLLANLRDVLTMQQQWRFWQITLQQEGYLSLVRGEVAEALELSLDQREQVALVVEQYHESRRALRESRDRTQRNERREKLTQETNETLSGLLSDAQKQLWDKMIGQQFPLARRDG